MEGITNFFNGPIIWFEEQMEKVLHYTAMFAFWVGVLLMVTGPFWWGQTFGIGCTGNYWDYCDNGVAGISFSGFTLVLWFWLGSISLVFSKLILKRLTVRGNTSFDE